MKLDLAALRKQNLLTVVKGFRVEPIAFINFLAMGIFHLVSQLGTYQVICYHTIGEDPRFDCATAARGGVHGHGHHRGHSNVGNVTMVDPQRFSSGPLPSPDYPDYPFADFDGPEPVTPPPLDGSRSGNWTRPTNETRIVGAHRSRNWTRGSGGDHRKRHNSSAISITDRPRSSGAGRNSHGSKDGHGRSAADAAEYAALEIKLQKAAVKWHLIFNLCHALPSLFADTLLGALGDRHGRQMNILIGLSGTMISIFVMSIMFTFPKAPLFILIISNLINGFTGFMSIIFISCFAYLADTVVDHEMLTVRMTCFSLVMSISGIIAPLIGGGLMNILSNAQVTLVAQSIIVGNFFLVLFIVKQRPPAIMRKIMLEKYIKQHGHPPPAGNEKFEKYHSKVKPNDTEKAKSVSDPKTESSKKKTLMDKLHLTTFGQLWQEVYVTYTKPRPGHARLYLLFTSFVYFLHIMFEGGLRMNVFNLYVLKSPFNWGHAELSAYKSINSALHLVGSLVGVVLFKKWLKLSDTTIILISMSTHVVECVLFAFARSTATLYVSATVGCLSMLMAPCIKSFISQLVDPDEVGKSFTAFGIASTVAHICSNLIYSGIYSATLGWFDGFAFLVAAVLECICMVLVCWLHFDYHYEGFKKWLKINPCARLIRRKRVAKTSPTPPPAYAMNEKLQEVIKVETAEKASDNFGV